MVKEAALAAKGAVESSLGEESAVEVEIRAAAADCS